MRGAVGAQWLALRRRPMVKVLFGIYMLLLSVQFFAPVGILNILPRLNSIGGAAPISPEAALGLTQTVRLPFAFATILGQVNGVGGLLLMVLAGAFVGGDSGWGMQRALLARQPDRARYLAAKFAALLLLAAALVLVSLPLGTLLAWLAGAALGLDAAISAADWGLLARGALFSWLGLIPYLALATMWAIVGRGAAAGIAGSLGYWLFEIGFGALAIFEALGAAGAEIYNLSLAQNVGALTDVTRRAFNLDLASTLGQFSFSFPPLGRAALFMLLYTALFMGVAWWSLRRRDVRGERS